ncbi:hypothetical protein [Baekduia alba]|nr:hypothetical protein [Baekduia alba]
MIEKLGVPSMTREEFDAAQQAPFELPQVDADEAAMHAWQSEAVA